MNNFIIKMMSMLIPSRKKRQMFRDKYKMSPIQEALSLARHLRARRDWEDSFCISRHFAPSPGRPKELLTGSPPSQEVLSRFQYLMEEPRLDYFLSLDTAPIPATADREGYYGEQHFAYWLLGLSDYLRLCAAFELKPGMKILDWGGATGRVARHFAAYHPNVNVTVADINRNHIDYINNIFDFPNLRGVKVSSLPFLPFEDNSLDLIYAFSVFTHIDEYETGWLAELSRILKPGGLAYLTIQSDKTWENLENTFVYNCIKDNEAFPKDWKPGASMLQDRMLFTIAEGCDYANHIFLHTKHINKVWCKFFDIKDIVYAGHSYQDVVLLGKK